MANVTQDPTFPSEQEGALDFVAREMIDRDEAQTEVVEGETDEEPDAIDNDGQGWHIEEVIYRIKRCKPRD